MKSIFYVSAALMIGAGIYGFVDYKKAIRNEEFKTMYGKENATTDPVTVATTTNDITRESVADPRIDDVAYNAEKEKATTKKRIKAKPGGRVIKGTGIKKQKKLDAEIFSRAPLRDIPELNEPPKIKKENRNN